MLLFHNLPEKRPDPKDKRGAQAGSAQEIGELIAKQVKLRHPNASHRVLDSDDNSVIVAFVHPATESNQKRFQLVRLLKGKRDMHRLAYTIKANELSEKTQAQWLNIFKSALLTEIDPQDDGEEGVEEKR